MAKKFMSLAFILWFQTLSLGAFAQGHRFITDLVSLGIKMREIRKTYSYSELKKELRESVGFDQFEQQKMGLVDVFKSWSHFRNQLEETLRIQINLDNASESDLLNNWDELRQLFWNLKSAVSTFNEQYPKENDRIKEFAANLELALTEGESMIREIF